VVVGVGRRAMGSGRWRRKKAGRWNTMEYDGIGWVEQKRRAIIIIIGSALVEGGEGTEINKYVKL